MQDTSLTASPIKEETKPSKKAPAKKVTSKKADDTGSPLASPKSQSASVESNNGVVQPTNAVSPKVEDEPSQGGASPTSPAAESSTKGSPPCPSASLASPTSPANDKVATPMPDIPVTPLPTTRPISVEFAADRLVGAAITGNLAVFEDVISEYRASKGIAGIKPADDDLDVASTDLLNYEVSRKNIVGPPLFWAGYSGQSNIIAHFQQCYGQVFKSQCIGVAKLLMDYHKDLAAVSILVRNGTPAAIIHDGRQEAALHRLVRRTKPNAALLHELLKTYRKQIVNADGEPIETDEEPDDVDAFNIDGYTPLQILAIYSRGIDGRTAAQVLLAHGADIQLPSSKGGNARTLAQNPHVRAVLGFRACPSPAIDDASKQIIDSVKSIGDLPPLPDLEVEQLKAFALADKTLNPQSATDEEKSMQMRAVRKLDKEGVDGMIRRLYDNTIQLREEKAAARRQALEPMESRRLTQDEQEAVADRLCNQSMEDKEAKQEELKEKYIVEREPNPLDEEQQAESANRLCNRSLEEKKAKLRELEHRYWGANASPKKTITKDQLISCAKRLHDESTDLTRTRFEKLATKYLVREKGEFEVKDTKRTPTEIAEAGARMAQGQASHDKK